MRRTEDTWSQKIVLDFMLSFIYNAYLMTKRRTHEEYEQILFDLQSDAFPLEQYVNTHTPILHICGVCKNVTKRAPKHVLNNHRCSYCAGNHKLNYELDVEGPAKVYYLKITGSCLTYYKLGVTSTSLRTRFMGDYQDKSFKVLKIWDFDTRREAFDAEQELLKQYKHLRNKDVKFLKSGGNTELFATDILNLDRKGSN